MSNQLWLHRSRVGGLAAAITGLAALTQQPIHRGLAAQVDALVEQRGIYHRRRHVSEALRVQHRQYVLTFGRTQRPRLRALPRSRRVGHRRAGERIRLCRQPFRVGPVVGGRRTTGRRTRGPNPDQRDHLLDGRVDHAQRSLSHIAALSAQSLSKSADSSPCTRITSRAVSSSARSHAISASAHWRRPCPAWGPAAPTAPPTPPDHADGAIRSATTNTGSPAARSHPFPCDRRGHTHQGSPACTSR